MSRMNATKSRADKTAAKTALAAATPVTHDIVPGKFTDHDWLLMLERDDGDDFIAELLDELYDSVDRIIYANYIQAQLVPFTVARAKDDILQIIEWQFLSRDEGRISCDVEAKDTAAAAAAGGSGNSGATEAKSNKSSDVSSAKMWRTGLNGWIPDQEPMAAVTDCWAQGSVPKLVSRPPRTATSMRLLYGSQHHSLEALPDTDVDENAEKSAGKMPSLDREISLLDDTELMAESAATSADALAPAELPKDDETNTHLLHETVHFQLPDTPKFETFLPSDIAPPSSGKGAGDELQNGSEKQVENVRRKEGDFRVEGVSEPGQPKSEEMPSQISKHYSTGARSKKTSADKPAEITADSEICLTSKMSSTQSKAGGDACLVPCPPLFERIRPSQLPSNQINTVYCLIDPAAEAAEARRLAIRNGRRQNVLPPNKPASADAATRKLICDKQSSARDPLTAYRPSLLDTMEISSGVVVRENGRVKKGPKQHRTMSQDADLLRSALRQGLQPVRVQHMTPPIGASELLESHVPVIKPLMEVPPIPPINQAKHMTSV